MVAVGGEEEAEAQRRVDVRARKFAREGELSKAFSVFDNCKVLDPRDADVMEQLRQLHEPDTEYEDPSQGPHIPDGLYKKE